MPQPKTRTWNTFHFRE